MILYSLIMLIMCFYLFSHPAITTV
jgi:hypothetical protein